MVSRTDGELSKGKARCAKVFRKLCRFVQLFPGQQWAWILCWLKSACSLPEESSCQLLWDWVLFSRIGWFMCQAAPLPPVQISSVRKLLESRESLICLVRSFKSENPSSPGNSPRWVALPSRSFQLFTEHPAKRIITGALGGAKRAKIRSLILRRLTLKTPLQIRRKQSRKSQVHKEGKKLWPRGILLSEGSLVMSTFSSLLKCPGAKVRISHQLFYTFIKEPRDQSSLLSLTKSGWWVMIVITDKSLASGSNFPPTSWKSPL